MGTRCQGPQCSWLPGRDTVKAGLQPISNPSCYSLCIVCRSLHWENRHFVRTRCLLLKRVLENAGPLVELSTWGKGRLAEAQPALCWELQSAISLPSNPERTSGGFVSKCIHTLCEIHSHRGLMPNTTSTEVHSQVHVATVRCPLSGS
jgi:hypothetical protein